MHRDIKPENFLVSDNKQILKEADFRFATNLKKNSTPLTDYDSTR